MVNTRVVIFILLLVVIACNFCYEMREGFVHTYNKRVTSCRQFTDCENCTTGYVNNTDPEFYCFWNNKKKKCGSFNDPGYSSKCTSASSSSSRKSTNSQYYDSDWFFKWLKQ